MAKVKSTNPEVRVIPVHQPEVVSPVCLIKDQTGPCNHKHCLMAYKKPQYFGISIAEFYNKKEFDEFTICHGLYTAPHIIPKNPGNDNDFEIFRQSMNAVCHLAGAWPDLETVARDHVEFRWTEYLHPYPVTNDETGKTDWKKRPDVSEYAYYVGPADVSSAPVIDVDAVYELPDVLKDAVRELGQIDEVYIPLTDWCHCGSEGDWCGEGCRQPHNKERVLLLERRTS